MPKKFEIQPNPEQRKKKFEIQPNSSDIRTKDKKFEVQSIYEESEENKGWWRQVNASDCGPMAILNGLNSIGFQGGPISVQQIRDAAALRRIRANESTESRMGDISTIGWLRAVDLWQYLVHDVGVPADVVVKNPNDIKRIKEELSTNPEKFYIMNTGNHFIVLKGTDNPQVYELLDSFNNGPESISKQRAFELIEEAEGVTGVLVG